MDFKLLSKNNIGAVSALILVILLTQSRVFDFLIDTSLGMFILIIFILGISYMNHNLGLVAVLLIIIIMNQNDSGYLEGFDIKNIGQKVKKPTTLDASGNTAEDDVSDDDKKIAIKNAMKNAMKKAKASTKSTTKESFVGGREGFNMIDREGTILKGKRSNEIPVLYNSRSQTDEDVEPMDNSMFKDSYSLF
jgi:hypothetical protein